MGKVPAGVDALCCKIEFRFCTDDSEALDPDIRAFLRYVDGKAAEGAFVQAFCKSDSAKDMQVFLQYVDGEAAQNLIEVSMAREWGDISSGLLCRMLRTRAAGIRGKVTAKGCVILFSEHTPCPGAEHTKQTEGRGTWVVFRSVFLLSLVLYKSYGMPGMLRGNA